MTDDEMAAAFNEWMREYTEDPAAFDNTLTTVKKFMEQESEGETPSYGAECTALMRAYHEKLTAAA